MKCKICKVLAYFCPLLCVPCTWVCKQMLVRYTDYASQFWFKTQMALNDKIFIYDSERCNVIFLRNIFNPTKLVITYIFNKRVRLVISKNWNICSIIWVCITNVMGRNGVSSTDWKVRWSNPGRGEMFRILPGRPWEPPSPSIQGYRVIPGATAVEAWL